MSTVWREVVEHEEEEIEIAPYTIVHCAFFSNLLLCVDFAIKRMIRFVLNLQFLLGSPDACQSQEKKTSIL